MKDSTLMKIAEAIAENESKCVAHKVGAVLVKDGRIVSTGYNGTPKGAPNCCDIHGNLGELDTPEKKAIHHDWSIFNELHAEHNAIMYSTPQDRKGATLYSTLQPCYICSLLIAGSGIERVVYKNEYHRTGEEPLKVLANANVIVEKLK